MKGDLPEYSSEPFFTPPMGEGDYAVIIIIILPSPGFPRWLAHFHLISMADLSIEHGTATHRDMSPFTMCYGLLVGSICPILRHCTRAVTHTWPYTPRIDPPALTRGHIDSKPNDLPFESLQSATYCDRGCIVMGTRTIIYSA
jgi:hypothetical protein